MNTTPFYQLTNCGLPLSEIIRLAREYDSTHDGEILEEILYTSAAAPPDREELCSLLSTKLRSNAPPPAESHFICSKGDFKCINALVKEYLTSLVNYSTWDGRIPCCFNIATKTMACKSYYDTSYLLEKVSRPTRLFIQEAIIIHAEKIKEKKDSKHESKHEDSKHEDSKHEHDSKIQEKDIQDVFTKCADLMIPKCPKCKAGFIDWDYCYSVKCQICDVDFCGVCLHFYGTFQETHDHIRTMCKKHQDWKPVNPVCHYYGSSPAYTALLYIRVQSHTAPWIEERRKEHKDPFLDAPTILEKVIAYLKLQPMRLRRAVIERLFSEMKKDIRLGTIKEYIIRDMFLVEINVKDQLERATNNATRFLLQDSQVRDNEPLCTKLLSDNKFPLNLLSFMDPVNFYDILIDEPYTPNPMTECRLLEEKLRFVLNPDYLFRKPLGDDIDYKIQRAGMVHDDNIFLLFRDALRKFHAVLAGGFVLNAVSLSRISIVPNQDLDVYVNLRHAKDLIFHLIELGFNVMSNHMSPAYDDSFMRKNNIIARVSFNHKRSKRSKSKHPPMDVMIIRDDTSIESVVTHFDLTICQIWYDGHTVRATHMQDITTKHGSLQPDYYRSYICGNTFIHNRINKYKRRGYTIDTPSAINPVVAPLLDELKLKYEQYRTFLNELKPLEFQLTLEEKEAEKRFIFKKEIIDKQRDIAANAREIRSLSRQIHNHNTKQLTGDVMSVIANVKYFYNNERYAVITLTGSVTDVSLPIGTTVVIKGSDNYLLNGLSLTVEAFDRNTVLTKNPGLRLHESSDGGQLVTGNIDPRFVLHLYEKMIEINSIDETTSNSFVSVVAPFLDELKHRYTRDKASIERLGVLQTEYANPDTTEARKQELRVEIHRIHEHIKDSARYIHEFSKNIYTNNKQLTGDNIEKWFILKMYEKMITIHIDKELQELRDDGGQNPLRRLAILLNYPMYPVTWDRLKEIGSALGFFRASLTELFTHVFTMEFEESLPTYYSNLIDEKRGLIMDVLLDKMGAKMGKKVKCKSMRKQKRRVMKSIRKKKGCVKKSIRSMRRKRSKSVKT
jgi:hypothetical protein